MSKVNKRKKKEKRKRKYKGIVMRPFCDPPRCPVGVREGGARECVGVVVDERSNLGVSTY